MTKNKLNNLLADLVVEYHKLQNFHWYVKGSDFFQVHAKLEELYDGVNGAIDEVAEKMLMIGGEPTATLKEFLALAKIQEPETKHLTSKEVFEEVLNDFNYLLSSVKEVKKAADAEENYLISAYADELIGSFSKTIWMINQVI
ncbi:MAG: DNA starvation/stationary phase protection protein [Erysipelotrichaceae bacterium]|nr:DNA starvation/stationary phase protection protein [Erysipelotrichaceae bacterium]